MVESTQVRHIIPDKEDGQIINSRPKISETLRLCMSILTGDISLHDPLRILLFYMPKFT